MRTFLSIALVVTVTCLAIAPGLSAGPVATTGTVGPFAGVATQGSSATHTYNNNPGGWDCIQLAVSYTVTLTHTPPTDSLVLTVGTRSVATTNGVATLSFTAGVCAEFDVNVAGAAVTAAAPYTVTVTGGATGGTAIEWA